jgi:hypothetical protein
MVPKLEIVPMIAPAQECVRTQPVPPWHEDFLAMLPAIKTHAKIVFRHLDSEAKEEAVQEVTANAAIAYARLVELGKADVAYPSALARYAVAQVQDGRKVGNRLNVRDVMSGYAQRRKGFKVERLDRYKMDTGEWMEILVEDRHVTPAELAASRIDFANWLASLSQRHRKIATTLAMGERAGRTARKFGVSHARISQIRRELFEAWKRFQGEDTVANQTTAVTF